MFYIGFTDINMRIKFGRGMIKFGEEQEIFNSSLAFWDSDKYLKQWREGVERLVSGYPSLLIVNINEPKNSNFINAWCLYPSFDRVLFTENLIFPNKKLIDSKFKSIYHSLPAYEKYDNEGNAVSTWELPKDSLVNFLKNEKL